MKLEDYHMQLNVIHEERDAMLKIIDKKEAALMRDYAFSNNDVKIGDIVKSKNGDLIRVTKVKFARSNQLGNMDLPCCVYIGDQLTKKLKPRAKPIELRIWQYNVERVITDE